MAIEERAVSPVAGWARRSLGIAVGLGGFAAALAVLSLSMRAVLDIGGACGTGPGFDDAPPCPSGVGGLAVAAVFGGLVATLLYAVSLVPRGPTLLPLLWPALFLTLGWNFVELGVWPPDGGPVVWPWVACGAVFGLLGGVPLFGILRPRRLGRMLWGDDGPAGWRSVVPTAPFRPGAGPVDRVVPTLAVPPVVERLLPTVNGHGSATGSALDGDAVPDVVARLERLADLRRRGALSEAEYQAAKREVLEGR